MDLKRGWIPPLLAPFVRCAKSGASAADLWPSRALGHHKGWVATSSIDGWSIVSMHATISLLANKLIFLPPFMSPSAFSYQTSKASTIYSFGNLVYNSFSFWYFATSFSRASFFLFQIKQGKKLGQFFTHTWNEQVLHQHLKVFVTIWESQITFNEWKNIHK